MIKLGAELPKLSQK